MGSLAISEECRLDGSLVLTARGVVDDATVECFERGLDRATDTWSRQVIVDLSICRLDSAGLAALVRLQRRSLGRPAQTRLIVSDVDLLRMLRIVRLTARMYPTMAAAVHSPPARGARHLHSV